LVATQDHKVNHALCLVDYTWYQYTNEEANYRR
jgi:hypothetical protein